VNIHEKYISRCIDLSKNGLGKTYPNPLVGSVIVVNGKIIGEGWHKMAGEPHAEVNAINSVEDKSLLKEATLYVNLEPCSHHGRTPPCADLIVESGLKTVVIGTIDANRKVGGKGVLHLKNKGCNVIVGVLENECFALNKRFFTFHNKKRPYIILKWAVTEDGFIDRIRNDNSAVEPNWISNKYSQQQSHKMRSIEQAILVGTTTALHDNPRLNVRNWKGLNPLRLVLDKTQKIPTDYSLMNGPEKTLVFTERSVKNKYNENVKLIEIDFCKNVPKQICEVLYRYEIQSVIIEGGAQTLQSFIDVNLWDEAYVFVGNKIFEKGLKSPELSKEPTEILKISNDTLRIYVNDFDSNKESGN
jgi:diaminohydroxyphosphoribosylaminopyrimidine deaminase/5-amino-6-(5-phosphoribosylamino)uracil reductase